MERGAAAVGDVRIRVADADEFEALVDIERRASVRFADVPGLEHWVGGDLTPIPALESVQRDGLVLVAETTDEAGRSERVGWCYAVPKDDSLFVEQIDVLPEFGRRGIGRSLLDALAAIADERGLQALTLTTDAHVAWNRPWYESIGFTVLAPDEQGTDVAEAVADEARRGFDLSRRVAMRRPLARAAGREPTDATG